MATEATAHPVRARRDVSTLILPAVGLTLVALVVAWLIVNLVQDPARFFRIFQIGISQGALYALVALGYTLVYGILELINFAHGDVFMLGGMVTASVVLEIFSLGENPAFGVLMASLLVSLVLATGGCAVLNATVERVAYKPLRNAPRLAPLITAIGVSFILENVAIIWKGTRPVALPETVLAAGSGHEIFTIGTCPNCVVYTSDRLFVVAVTIPVLLGLLWLVRFTRQGKAMRATAQDKDAAAMMGIDVNRTISFTFLVAGALAGVGGVIYAYYATSIGYSTGFTLGLFAFTAAVLGGIGNLPGAVLGAVIIGLIQAFNEGLPWHAPGTAWTQALVFSILILILVFRPQGLLGEQTPEGG